MNPVDACNVVFTFQIWNDRHAEADVVPTLKESLAKLNLDYLDLYLVHWPMSISVSFIMLLLFDYCFRPAQSFGIKSKL